MSGNIAPYTSLITSEHNQRPDFMAMVALTLQPLADNIAVIESIPGLYDVDVAVGVQLDTVGEWVGVTRYLEEPLENVYFSWGTAGLGWGEGVWKGPFDPSTGLVELPDVFYRILLYATIAANNWDGTIPGAYAVWNTIFAEEPGTLLIQDNGNMTMIMALLDPSLNVITTALLANGYFRLKPAGVQMTTMIPSVPGAPLFGFGVENDNIAGWGVGCWPDVLSVL